MHIDYCKECKKLEGAMCSEKRIDYRSVIMCSKHPPKKENGKLIAEPEPGTRIWIDVDMSRKYKMRKTWR